MSSDRLERLSLASARIPFKLKVGAVWVILMALSTYFFWLTQFDINWMADNFSFIAGGLRYTIYTALGGISLAVVLALVGALARISTNPIASGISGLYVSFFRGTPLIVQMFLVYLALPQVAYNLHANYPQFVSREVADSLVLSPAVAGILVLGVNYGAYMTEIFRAGIESVASGQGEAADALGMNYRQKMRQVVLPQAFRVVIPPTGNMFIVMTKDTALVSFLGVAISDAEIFRRAQVAGQGDFRNLEALLVAAALYWGLTIFMTYFQRRLERRMGQAYARGGRLPTTKLPAHA